ncbi:lasso peptide biosynthesis PqqD family chaperone [Streptomyces sp. NPDC057496]|uniref:lasso peptide biosynthesis PqqD family chaperone n=1 Tax=Streptomyces sp. NPDC057496 TaxID=3346149 RepID=UPI0036BC2E2E
MALRLHPDVAATETDDGVVLLHQRTGRYWQLNSSGNYVLQSLLEGSSVDHIASVLSGRYEIERDRASRDVTRLAEQLIAARLLETGP